MTHYTPFGNSLQQKKRLSMDVFRLRKLANVKKQKTFSENGEIVVEKSGEIY